MTMQPKADEMPSPENDGVSHVNVYTKSKTHLGRMLSNLTECNIVHPYFGHFRTLEGLWFYMKTGFKDDTFRIIKGHDARQHGKKLPSSHYPAFSKMFKLGMLEKLASNPKLQEELLANELPLTHYYSYGNKVVSQDRHQWQLDHWLLMRSVLLSTGSLDSLRKELMEEINYVLDKQDSQ